MPSRLKALVFDAYGTLFDVHSVIALCDQFYPGKGEAMSLAWRQKQLEYTWLKSLMGEYEPFSQITERSMRFACRRLNVPCDMELRARMMDAYLKLDPYPEAAQALDALAPLPRAILSNGSPDMLLPLVEHTGFDKRLEAVISVDEVKVFKPSPRVYELVPKKLGVPKEAVGFVSSNYWDAVGAKSYGFRVFWINRGGNVPDELGHEPDAVLERLTDLAQHVF